MFACLVGRLDSSTLEISKKNKALTREHCINVKIWLELCKKQCVRVPLRVRKRVPVFARMVKRATILGAHCICICNCMNINWSFFYLILSLNSEYQAFGFKLLVKYFGAFMTTFLRNRAALFCSAKIGFFSENWHKWNYLATIIFL